MKKKPYVGRECPTGQGRQKAVCLEIESFDSNGRLFRVRYYSKNNNRFLGFLKNESCHVTKKESEALKKVHRSDAVDNGRWCAGRKPTWPIGRRQKAYARFLGES
jgi:hypothetical protein